MRVLPLPESTTADPDSEGIAVALVANRLRSEGFTVHDTQQDGCGYDLRAERDQPPETQYVEVKGLAGSASSQGVRLTAHEVLRAGLLRDRYWLYVVDRCSEGGRLFAAYSDPFEHFAEAALGETALRIPGAALAEAREPVAEHPHRRDSDT